VKNAINQSSDIVIIDCTGVERLTTHYNAFLHTINVADAAQGDREYLPPPNNYFVYFRRALFELCNAASGTKLRNIHAQAAAGDLDCLNFVLGLEILECESEDLFNGLWRKVENDKTCCTILTTEGQERLKPPNFRFPQAGIVTDHSVRIKAQLDSGHIRGYIDLWARHYKAAYAGKNKVAHDAFIAWVQGKGDKPNFKLAQVVEGLTGVALTGSFIFFEKYFPQPRTRKLLQLDQ